MELAHKGWSIWSLETVASCQSTTIKRASVRLSRSHASSIEPVTTSRDPWTERDSVQKNSSQVGFSVTARMVTSIIRGTLRACDEHDLFVFDRRRGRNLGPGPAPVEIQPSIRGSSLQEEPQLIASRDTSLQICKVSLARMTMARNINSKRSLRPVRSLGPQDFTKVLY